MLFKLSYTLLLLYFFDIIVENNCYARNINRKKNSGDIAFPDEIFVLRDKPKCKGGTTYCEDLDNYPVHYLNNNLQRSGYKYEMFGAPINNSDLSDRFGSDDNFLCSYRKFTIFPKAAQNSNKQWKYIYNFKNYIQGVQIEICYGGKSCKFLSDLPMHIRAECKQRYIQRRLLCANEEGRPVVDYFLLPSSCACSYTVDYGWLFAARSDSKSIQSREDSSESEKV